MCGTFIRYVLWPALMFPIACSLPLVEGAMYPSDLGVRFPRGGPCVCVLSRVLDGEPCDTGWW